MRACWLTLLLLSVLVTIAQVSTADPPSSRLLKVAYLNPGETADLGIGLYASPVVCDRNGDGLLDLIVMGGGRNPETVYFENTGRLDRKTGTELFKAGVVIGKGHERISYNYLTFHELDGRVRVISPRFEYPDFINTGIASPVALEVPEAIRGLEGRGNQWSFVDFNADGALDLVIGLGLWGDYAAEMGTGFDRDGVWIGGPLHGHVHVALNRGTTERPDYDAPFRLEAGGRVLDVFGTPSPVFGDFRGTGKLDLICGEFLTGFTYFENTGTEREPLFKQGFRLRAREGLLQMSSPMIVVNAADWNRDGRPDLVVAQEDGRVAWIENNGRPIEVRDRHGRETVALVPGFEEPRFFRQEAAYVKLGAICSPVAWDWDKDGDEDIIAGNAAGEIHLVENLGGFPPRWAEPRRVEADGIAIREVAGYNGSIQGPSEAKWGYLNIGIGDWDGDGLVDLLVQLVTGKVVWYRNIGTRTEPRFARKQPVRVAWDRAPPKPVGTWWAPEPGELAVQWRSTPCVIDLDRDGIPDLVSIDHEGYLAWFRQVRDERGQTLQPGRRIFHRKSVDGVEPLRLNANQGGHGGRKTYCFADWDGDGLLDLFVNGRNADYFHALTQDSDRWVFEDRGAVDPRALGGYSSTPAVVDWNMDSVPDLLIGAEDGYLYYLENPRTAKRRGGS